MPFSAELLVFAPLIVVLAYMLFGLSGFGSTLFSAPLLAHFLPLRFVVPTVVLLDFCASLTLGTRFRESVNRRELIFLVPVMLAGIALGVTLLVNLPQRAALGSLGAFALGYGLFTLRGSALPQRISRLWAVPAGIVGGALGALFGSGGPVYVMYLSGRLDGKAELRSTVSAVIVISSAFRILMFALAGLLFRREQWLMAAGLVPFMLLGLFVGNRLHVNLSRAQLARLVSGLLVVNGASLLWRAL